MTRLSDLLTELNSEQWSSRRIANEADKLGFAMSHDTANKYLSGRHGAPEEPTLQALAAVFRVDVEQLRRAAGLASGGLGPYQPPQEGHRLGQRERDLVDELIRMLAATSARSELATFASELIAKDRHVADVWLASSAPGARKAWQINVKTSKDPNADFSWDSEPWFGPNVYAIYEIDMGDRPRLIMVDDHGRAVALDPVDDDDLDEQTRAYLQERHNEQVAREIRNRAAHRVSARGDTSEHAIAAHEEEGSIVGEQEESDTP